MRKHTLLAVLLISFCTTAMAQSPILKNVKIEYEKKVNSYASMPADMVERMRGQVPQYATTNFTYETNGEKAIYKSVPTEQNQGARRGRGFMRNMSVGGGDNTTIYTDFKKDQQVALKEVFEKTYLITDSIPQYNWKITNEFRTIAGFNCRRANAIIMDSVFVVAFYTDEIIAPGGPESMGGLPGTILGLVVNRVHTTWYATSVNVTDVSEKDIVPPEDKKAEKTDRKNLIETVGKRFNESGGGWFGNMGDMLIWNLTI